MLAIDTICVAVVIGAVGLRVATTARPTTAGLAAAVGLPVAFVIGLAVWLPGGPLAAGWAKRAGTPTKLLAHRTVTR
jgi:hypothetical protein